MTLITGLNGDRSFVIANWQLAIGNCEFPPAGGLCHTQQGFTLVELILVMVLICSILGIAAPSLRGFFVSHQTTDAARQIVALIQLARSQAITEGRTYRFNFDSQAGTYWLTAQDGAAFVNLNSEFGRTFSLPEGAAFDPQADPAAAAAGYIDFYPNGTSSAATVRLIGRQGQCVEISSPALTEAFGVVTTLEGSRS